MNEEEQYSVFDELPPERPSKNRGQYQRVIYFVFAIYFIIHASSRWTFFFATRSVAITNDLTSINAISLPYLLSAISGTAIVISSIILFIRKSMRAAIGLLILGAILELLISYFIRS